MYHKHIKWLLISSIFLVLIGCGGGGGSSITESTPTNDVAR